MGSSTAIGLRGWLPPRRGRTRHVQGDCAKSIGVQAQVVAGALETAMAEQVADGFDADPSAE
jgi:hypothetical protein